MIFTILVTLVFFTVLILGHELGHFLTAKLFGLRVEEFAFGFPPRLFSRTWRGTKYSFNLIPFGGFVKIYGEESKEESLEGEGKSFRGIAHGKKAVVIASGVIMNVLIGYAAFVLVFMIGIPASTFVSGVLPGSPAEIAGFKAGDELTDFKKPEGFVDFINKRQGEKIEIKVVRGGESLTLQATPRVNPPSGQGRLGVSVTEGGIPKQNLYGALIEAGLATLEAAKLIFNAFLSLFGGLFRADLETLNNVTGPVGIFGILGAASHLGIQYLLQLLALISLNLAILNLLPFPALDGGRLLFILIEGITGRRINYKFEAMAHTFGFAFLLLLMTIVTLHDIIKIL